MTNEDQQPELPELTMEQGVRSLDMACIASRFMSADLSAYGTGPVTMEEAVEAAAKLLAMCDRKVVFG